MISFLHREIVFEKMQLIFLLDHLTETNYITQHVTNVCIGQGEWRKEPAIEMV